MTDLLLLLFAAVAIAATTSTVHLALALRRSAEQNRRLLAWIDELLTDSAARKAAVPRVAPASPGLRTAAFRVPEERHGGAPEALG